RRDGRAPVVTKLRDDQEARLLGITGELPHRASEQVLEGPDPMPGVHISLVVRFALDELGRCRHARKAEHMQAPRRRFTIGSQRWPARDHRVGEPVHVEPMLLEEIAFIAQAFGTRSVLAVDEEVHSKARVDRRRRDQLGGTAVESNTGSDLNPPIEQALTALGGSENAIAFPSGSETFISRDGSRSSRSDQSVRAPAAHSATNERHPSPERGPRAALPALLREPEDRARGPRSDGCSAGPVFGLGSACMNGQPWSMAPKRRWWQGRLR